MDEKKQLWEKRRKRTHEIIEVGYIGDWASRGYDWFGTIMLFVNLVVTIMETFDAVAPHYTVLNVLEEITVAFFALDYVLRVWAAPYLYEDLTHGKATRKYLLSPSGIVDLLSFLPHYLPIVFPAGAAVFRMFRVVRILRLFHQCDHGGHFQQEAAAVVLGVYHSGADGGLQPVHVQSGA